MPQTAPGSISIRQQQQQHQAAAAALPRSENQTTTPTTRSKTFTAFEGTIGGRPNQDTCLHGRPSAETTKLQLCREQVLLLLSSGVYKKTNRRQQTNAEQTHRDRHTPTHTISHSSVS